METYTYLRKRKSSGSYSPSPLLHTPNLPINPDTNRVRLKRQTSVASYSSVATGWSRSYTSKGSPPGDSDRSPFATYSPHATKPDTIEDIAASSKGAVIIWNPQKAPQALSARPASFYDRLHHDISPPPLRRNLGIFQDSGWDPQAVDSAIPLTPKVSSTSSVLGITGQNLHHVTTRTTDIGPSTNDEEPRPLSKSKDQSAQELPRGHRYMPSRRTSLPWDRIDSGEPSTSASSPAPSGQFRSSEESSATGRLISPPSWRPGTSDTLPVVNDKNSAPDTSSETSQAEEESDVSHDETDLPDIPDIDRDPQLGAMVGELQERTARYMLPLLTLRDVGCSQAEHSTAQTAACRAHEGFPCYSLQSTFNPRSFLKRINNSTTKIGLSSTSFPEPSEFSRSRFIHEDAIKEQLEGTASPDIPPRNICINSDHRDGPTPEVEYDFDGFLIFMNSFTGFAEEQSLQLTFVKQTRYNINSNLHIAIPITIEEENKTQLRHIKKIPHLYLGSIQQIELSTIFILFPALIESDEMGSWLTDRHAERFFDIWLTALRRHASTFLVQYLPATHECAEGRARAKGLEHQSAARENLLKQSRSYPIPIRCIQLAWAEVEVRIEQTPGLAIFKHARLFVNTKNTKLHQSAGTMLHAIYIFKNEMSKVFKLSEIRYFADIGVKIVPPKAAPRLQNPPDPVFDSDSDAESRAGDAPSTATTIAHTYLWKTCCLKAVYDRMRKDTFGGFAGTKQKYYNGYLRDATHMTIEPPPKSWIRKSGLLYIQGYNSCKDIEDAQQIRPFDLARLPNLALDAELVGPQTVSTSRSTLIQSYLAGKQRVDREYQAARSTSFGSRLEARLADGIIDAFQQLLEDEGLDGHTDDEPPPITPSFLWCVPTKLWCEFMHNNFDKITSVIEMIILSSDRKGINRSSSELLFALFLYLQNFSNSNPARFSLVWKNTRESKDGIEELGLGLERTIDNYGFGWIAELADWQGLRLYPRAVGNLIGCKNTIGIRYKDAMRLHQDQRGIMELLHQHIQSAEMGSLRHRAALKTAVHFIFRQYRRDVLDFLTQKKELNKEYLQDRRLRDSVIFCDHGLSHVLVQKPFYVSGFRICGAYDPSELCWLLMGTKDHARSRKNFDGPKQKEWRRMLFTIQRAVIHDVQLQKELERRILIEFRKYFWAIPYPDPQGVFMEVNSVTGQRKFYATRDENGEWRCAGLQPRTGMPPPYPRALGMSLEELVLYLQCKSPTRRPNTRTV